MPGYTRINGVCQLESECPPVCPQNQYYDNWGVCDGNCTNLFAVCPRNPRPGCACYPGLVRDIYGNCIEPNYCPSCDVGEDWYEVGYCEGVCGTGNSKCDTTCLKRGCYCKQGYVRNADDKCIPQEACPSGKN